VDVDISIGTQVGQATRFLNNFSTPFNFAFETNYMPTSVLHNMTPRAGLFFPGEGLYIVMSNTTGNFIVTY